MSGTKEGGKAAARTNKALYGDDFYSKIGKAGGKKGTTGGFWYAKYVRGDDNFAREQGVKGGTKSRRNGVSNVTTTPRTTSVESVPHSRSGLSAVLDTLRHPTRHTKRDD